MTEKEYQNKVLNAKDVISQMITNAQENNIPGTELELRQMVIDKNRLTTKLSPTLSTPDLKKFYNKLFLRLWT